MKKVYATMVFSSEMIYTEKAWTDGRYARKAIRTEAPPTSEAWERYRAAKAGLAALEAYEGTEWGGPDYGTEVPEPEPTVTFEYLETHDEWLARCDTLSA
ncbi:hypothetical protein [Arthrobacter sp. ES3-54]|uniref:hypothetical protein n=1 Tax=Arthrobacter sp. ES3-54 TaxID=1502991 RepID=UPI002406CFD5|nr:hypothetical protein [Arthrobacter sp. ES3-54]MDF9748651.1 hypothetical protein [Arthrobacter sp. ES3-54]